MTGSHVHTRRRRKKRYRIGEVGATSPVYERDVHLPQVVMPQDPNNFMSINCNGIYKIL